MNLSAMRNVQVITKFSPLVPKVGDKGLPHPLPSTESDCYISALQENVKSTKILAPAVLTCIALKQTDSGNSGLVTLRRCSISSSAQIQQCPSNSRHS
ncbi:hypothetical protein F4825DRAFT_211543 [Nemania diffusa]|nr:hypothetical protein F4825DRAFT_211543 [Nemania diffusa]